MIGTLVSAVNEMHDFNRKSQVLYDILIDTVKIWTSQDVQAIVASPSTLLQGIICKSNILNTGISIVHILIKKQNILYVLQRDNIIYTIYCIYSIFNII